MRNIKILMSIGAIIVVSMLFSMPNVAAADNEMHSSSDYNDVLLFIRGGLGVHFTVINDGNETVQVEYEIIGQGIFVNKTWHDQGNFSAAPGLSTSYPPRLVPGYIMPITAYLRADGYTASRMGISFMGLFVIFFF